MKSTITKLMTLAALCALAAPVFAQSEDEDKPQPRRKKVQEQVERTQARVQEVLEKVQGELGDKLGRAQAQLEGQFAKAGQAFKLAQAGLALEPPEPPEVPVVRSFNFAGNDVFLPPGSQSSLPLVINTSDASPAALAETREDLSVMARILKKAASRGAVHDKHEDEAAAMGIVLSNIPGGRRADSFYLEGYGAVFMLNVRFPLVAPTEVEEKKVEKVPDTTWEKTKRELYGPRGPQAGGGKVDLFFTNGMRDDGPARKYDVERVDSLKQELLAALKNGANLRRVKPDEFVAIAVVGGAASGGKATVERIKSGKNKKKATRSESNEDADGDVKSEDRVEVLTLSAPGGPAPQPTNLTIRVRKSDIDAFAKGDLDLEGFQKKAVINVY